jgi:hypothetical protein
MEDLQNDLAPTIRTLYERLGFQMTPEFEAYIRAQDTRQKTYTSTHHYDPASYGLSETGIYKEFSDIFERFSYPRPVGAKDGRPDN